MPAHECIPGILDRLDTEGRVSVAGLGDSLTHGWAVRRGYFERFCDVLEQRHAGAVVSRLNAGVPGDTAAGGVARLSQVLARQPDVLLVQFGINDMRSDEPVDAFEQAISHLTRTAIQFAILPVLATSCPLPDVEQAAAIAPYYEAIRRVAGQWKTPVADLEAHWIAHHGSPDLGCPLFLADGVHPTDEGHAILAQGLLACFSRDTWLAPAPEKDTL